MPLLWLMTVIFIIICHVYAIWWWDDDDRWWETIIIIPILYGLYHQLTKDLEVSVHLVSSNPFVCYCLSDIDDRVRIKFYISISEWKEHGYTETNNRTKGKRIQSRQDILNASPRVSRYHKTNSLSPLSASVSLTVDGLTEWQEQWSHQHARVIIWG